MDTLTPSERSKRMSLVRNRDTKPEMLVRRTVHGLGYRFRLHRAELPGKPDLVFPSRRKVIFVNGCFWHQHDDPDCRLARLPKTRLDFWIPKLQGNVERDAHNLSRLGEAGWESLVIWECQTKDSVAMELTITNFLG